MNTHNHNLKKLFLSIFIFIFSLFSCSNPLTQVSNASTDEALYEDAQKALNSSNWDLSISKFETLSASFLSQREVRFKYAKALAGKCGFNFITLSEILADADLNSTSFFSYLLSMWGNKSISPSHCTLSETQMKLIWDGYTASGEEQLFMALLSFSKMGMYLRTKADNDENLSLGDGTVDAGFNECSSADTNDTLTDSEIKEVTTGLGLFIQNIAGVSSIISSSLDSEVTSLSAVCALLTPNPCTAINPEDITPEAVATMRDLLRIDTIGIDTCINIDPTTCCP